MKISQHEKRYLLKSLKADEMPNEKKGSKSKTKRNTTERKAVTVAGFIVI